MDKTLRIVIPNPSPVIPNAVRNLILLLRINSVRNLVFSEIDCYVASLLVMTFIKESLNLGNIYLHDCTFIVQCILQKGWLSWLKDYKVLLEKLFQHICPPKRGKFCNWWVYLESVHKLSFS